MPRELFKIMLVAIDHLLNEPLMCLETVKGVALFAVNRPVDGRLGSLVVTPALLRCHERFRHLYVLFVSLQRPLSLIFLLHHWFFKSYARKTAHIGNTPRILFRGGP